MALLNHGACRLQSILKMAKAIQCYSPALAKVGHMSSGSTVDRYVLLPRHLRQAYIRQTRGFNCKCPLCIEQELERLDVEEELEALGHAAPVLTSGQTQICCCVMPWMGQLVPMIHLALALQAQKSTVVSFITTTLGVHRLRTLLGNKRAKLNLVQIDDGSDEDSERVFARLLQTPGQEPFLEANLTVAGLAKEHVQSLVKQGVTHFVLDWLSFGFAECIRASGAQYCISMPGSTLQAEFGCAVRDSSECSSNTQRAIQSITHNAKILVHGFPGMFGARVGQMGDQMTCVGILASEPETLPADVEAFLNSAGPPVLYVFLGSLTVLTVKELEVLCRAVSSPGEWRVMWSLPEDLQVLLPSISRNAGFFLSHWLPQASILRHPACIAALIHAGWSSLADVILSGKPVCALPLFGDQPINAQIVQTLNIGLTISAGRSLGDMDPKRIQASIRAVIQDSRFSEAARAWKKAAGFGGADYAAGVVRSYFDQEGRETLQEGRADLEMAAVTLAEDMRSLSFDDGDAEELLPMGAQLEAWGC